MQQSSQGVEGGVGVRVGVGVGVVARSAHFLEPMGVLGISGSNGNCAEDAEAHAGLADCMVPGGAANAKPCWHNPCGLPC